MQFPCQPLLYSFPAHLEPTLLPSVGVLCLVFPTCPVQQHFLLIPARQRVPVCLCAVACSVLRFPFTFPATPQQFLPPPASLLTACTPCSALPPPLLLPWIPHSPTPVGRWAGCLDIYSHYLQFLVYDYASSPPASLQCAAFPLHFY